MEHRHWHAAYPAGMPIDVKLPAEETLTTMVERAMIDYADRPAATSAGESLSYRKLESLSRTLGAYLLHSGLGKGDRVGLMMPNGLGYHVSLVATLRAALVAVPVNPLYTPRELTHQLSDAGVRVLFLAEQLLEPLRDVILGAGVELIITVPIAGVLASIDALLRFRFSVRRERAYRSPRQSRRLLAWHWKGMPSLLPMLHSCSTPVVRPVCPRAQS